MHRARLFFVVFSITVILLLALPRFLIYVTAFVCMAITAYFVKEYAELKKQTNTLTNTEVLECSDLTDSAKYQDKFVRLLGSVKPLENELLKAPYSDKDCIHYTSTTRNKYYIVYEEIIYSGQGKHRTRRIVRRSKIEYETTAFNSLTVPFYVSDGSNDILIGDVKKVTIDGKPILHNEEKKEKGLFIEKSICNDPLGKKLIATIKEEKILAPSETIHVAGFYYTGEKGPTIGEDPTGENIIFYAGCQSPVDLAQKSDTLNELYLAIIGMSVISLLFLIHGKYNLLTIIEKIFLFKVR